MGSPYAADETPPLGPTNMDPQLCGKFILPVPYYAAKQFFDRRPFISRSGFEQGCAKRSETAPVKTCRSNASLSDATDELVSWYVLPHLSQAKVVVLDIYK